VVERRTENPCVASSILALGTMKKLSFESFFMPRFSCHFICHPVRFFSMRLTIDARMMGPANTRGIGRVVEELVKAIQPMKGADEVTLVQDAIPWYGVAEQTKLPDILSATRPDVVFFPHWNVPLLYRAPFVVMIHDLLLLHEPASAKISTKGFLTQLIKRIGYRIVLSHAIRGSKKILVPTEDVAADIRRFYRSAESKIVVIGEGMPVPDVDSVLQPPEQPPYLLMVGSAYPHKGHETFFDAWSVVAEAHPDLRLRIVGEKDVFMNRLIRLAEERKLPRIEFLGSVDDARLADLYRRATAYVFPSRFEGFGLPPLEALSHGCPALVSDIPVLREVLGNESVIFFQPSDSDAILRAISRVVSGGQETRAEAIRSARELAHRHSWRRSAEKTLQAIRESIS
jgi:glycosyltransferase involved in cell wall biosynthesis